MKSLIINTTLVVAAASALYFASAMLDGASFAGLDFAFSDWVG